MDKVVILARVSTDRQEYRRQINELKSFCQKMDWDIVGTSLIRLEARNHLRTVPSRGI